jgi:hypothetical protein
MKMLRNISISATSIRKRISFDRRSGDLSWGVAQDQLVSEKISLQNYARTLQTLEVWVRLTIPSEVQPQWTRGARRMFQAVILMWLVSDD